MITPAEIDMTIFKSSLNAKKLQQLLFEDQEFLLNYLAVKDVTENGIFVIYSQYNEEEEHTIGIKNNAIWTPGFSFFIEKLLTRKGIEFIKLNCQFKTTNEAQLAFLQKYLM